MERRFILAKAGTSLKDTISAEDTDDLRAIIVEREGRIVGLIPPRSGLWREFRAIRTSWSNVLSKVARSSAGTSIS